MAAGAFFALLAMGFARLKAGPRGQAGGLERASCLSEPAPDLGRKNQTGADAVFRAWIFYIY
jgi:hypothetical protein